MRTKTLFLLALAVVGATSLRAQAPAPDTAPKDVILFDVLDQTASVKVRAYWGTDYLLLGRFDGHWMITHVLWQSPPQPKRPS